ncbi:hypothetical protein B4U79_01980 [Dinothrombium tinctorium]|uniref:Uncharacterized protein n=1 Tax=Dinothrombium tinctorium TaxID=1965070 RepID=A0A3S3NJD1_9ACAR|nr:hypothetical protein B4U79_01980 [Dinothrombium tinctorium]
MDHRLAVISVLAFVAIASSDMMRKSIVFDIKTPKVFYCPQEKPKDMSKMIVKSRPLEALCEYEGKGVPKNSIPDCYNDIDESEYACAEKQRILLRINPPNDTDSTTTVIPTPDAPQYIIKSHKKSSGKKKY